MFQDPIQAAAIQKVIFDLRKKTLSDGHHFLLSSSEIADLPPGQSFYESAGDRFTVEELMFSAAGDYGTRHVRMATAAEVAKIKEVYSYFYTAEEPGTPVNLVHGPAHRVGAEKSVSENPEGVDFVSAKSTL